MHVCVRTYMYVKNILEICTRYSRKIILTYLADISKTVRLYCYYIVTL